MPEQRDFRRRATPVVAPLAEIRLENFKSVSNATVELRPLSVVVGRNSSGKSTLLQAVLALAQAVRNRSNSVQFPLNGEYVKLGTFGEVLSFQNTDDDAEIAIGVSVAADSRSPRMRPGRSARDANQWSSISWTGHLSAPEELSNGFAELSAFEFGIATRDDVAEGARVSLDVSSVRGEIQREGPWPVAVEPRVFRPDRSLLWVDGRIVDLTSGNSSRVDSVTVVGGLPTAAFRNGARFSVYARMWWDIYNEILEEPIKEQKAKNGERIGAGEPIALTDVAVGIAVDDFVEAYRIQSNPTLIDDNPTLVDDDGRPYFFNTGMSRAQRIFERRLIQLHVKHADALVESLVSLGEAEFNVKLREALSGYTWRDEFVQEDIGSQIGGDLWHATRNVERLFRELQYLGPLRAEPKVNYDPGPSRIDLGTKGEYSAAVLHAQREHKIFAPVPSGRDRWMPLGQALNLWLVELGLADAANATDMGRLGIGLTVSPAGSGKNVDLTSVGVGVSQVLPVLLLCLLARKGSVVLIEQPELHLHPEMQLRLADFLLACARSGRQILVETHSEHLVNRLRLHVAEDESSVTSDLVQLLFAEQENGVTSYRSSQINPIGGLSEDWPRGFLDVGAGEAGQLLRQTVLRQRQISAAED